MRAKRNPRHRRIDASPRRRQGARCPPTPGHVPRGSRRRRRCRPFRPGRTGRRGRRRRGRCRRGTPDRAVLAGTTQAAGSGAVNDGSSARARSRGSAGSPSTPWTSRLAGRPRAWHLAREAGRDAPAPAADVRAELLNLRRARRHQVGPRRHRGHGEHGDKEDGSRRLVLGMAGSSAVAVQPGLAHARPLAKPRAGAGAVVSPHSARALASVRYPQREGGTNRRKLDLQPVTVTITNHFGGPTSSTGWRYSPTATRSSPTPRHGCRSPAASTGA